METVLNQDIYMYVCVEGEMNSSQPAYNFLFLYIVFFSCFEEEENLRALHSAVIVRFETWK